MDEMYKKGRKATFQIGEIDVEDMIAEYESINVNGIKGCRVQFGKLNIAFFFNISSAVGAAGDDGETLEELQDAIRLFVSNNKRQTEQERYLNERRRAIISMDNSLNPLLPISAECV
ncbi:MAG: hypothetical protein M1383_02500 [Patescibacteria group bacterium]|nr:hypothetical protein [Patescibacteria group bacterium]